ncbi:uncharacterized protein LOC116258963 isoform X2 [Nymphaea colorata]|nr:uncharacterized protein LOC116258963 isoform X2 [Nymphaea colorata]
MWGTPDATMPSPPSFSEQPIYSGHICIGIPQNAGMAATTCLRKFQKALVFDFQPQDPEDIFVALAALSGRQVPGISRVRSILAVPKSRSWYVGFSKGNAVELAHRFNKSWEEELQLGRHDCRHYTNGLPHPPTLIIYIYFCVCHMNLPMRVVTHVRMAGQKCKIGLNVDTPNTISSFVNKHTAHFVQVFTRSTIQSIFLRVSMTRVQLSAAY